jgi:hypothetical protein
MCIGFIKKNHLGTLNHQRAHGYHQALKNTEDPEVPERIPEVPEGTTEVPE